MGTPMSIVRSRGRSRERWEEETPFETIEQCGLSDCLPACLSVRLVLSTVEDSFEGSRSTRC